MKPDSHTRDMITKREEIQRKRSFHLRKHFEESGNHQNIELISQFTDILLKRFSPTFLSKLSDQELTEMVEHRFSFFENNWDKGLSVRVEEMDANEESEFNKGVVIENCMPDMPFIVDSVEEYLIEKNYLIRQFIYPVVTVKQDESGQLSSIKENLTVADGSISYFSCVIDWVDEKKQEQIKKDIEEILLITQKVTSDFLKVKHTMEILSQIKNEFEQESLRESELRLLFQWFSSGKMILLGAGEFQLQDATKDLTWDMVMNPLGYLGYKQERNSEQFLHELNKAIHYFMQTDLVINLFEIEEASVVHKRDKIQFILHKGLDKDGEKKVFCFPALFTNKSTNLDVLSIPLARLKVNRILESLQNNESSFDYKSARDFFNSLPKSELFRLERKELATLLDYTTYAWESRKAKVFTFVEDERGYARITVTLPSIRFHDKAFEQVGELIETAVSAKAELKYWSIFGRQAYAHYIFWFPEGHPRLSGVNFTQMEEDLFHHMKPWEDALQEVLDSLRDKAKSAIFKSRFSDTFNKIYQATHSPQDAIEDMEYLNKVLDTGREQVELKALEKTNRSQILLYSNSKYRLADLMPRIQNLGMIAQHEIIYEMRSEDTDLWIYAFRVEHEPIEGEDFLDLRDRFIELFQAVQEGEFENDSLNALLCTAGLTKNEIDLMMIYRNYYWQIGNAYEKNTINRALLDNAAVVRILKDYFYKKFVPSSGLNHENEDHLADFKADLRLAISEVKTVSEDVIFKSFLNLIESTVRTNYFARKPGSALAIKIRSEMVELMPLPRPLFEVYVHGVGTEAIHLRGGKIARGGIRFSDRADDFRTEVLGLMKTQMMKNAVIVPEGSKGGFILKHTPSNRDELMAEVEKQYRFFMQALLSVTDNILHGEIKPPENVVRYDEDDPYLVVAADKGTAHLSDVANEISTHHGFWLGDAFASGGSAGYSHKGVGITARGAWENVKLHFLEKKIDIQKEPFTVVGIGDMAGDVFGNGMLLSKFIQLKGAFNHLHIFIDPNPDHSSSWLERKRLFDKPGTSWLDYNTSLISKGGGIFNRNAKEIQLTPQMKEFLDLEIDSCSGEELIRHILRANVDLLWNGGIGTYIKASSETSLEVGDQANNNVRISADEVRANVIGEGGNLGLTQQARIEFAQLGGAINADAIDNSAGVDMSDHEVNLKIMINQFMLKGVITTQQERNDLLAELTEDVTAHCLADNIEQGRILTMDARRSITEMPLFTEQIQFLAEKGMLDRRTENIPGSEQFTLYQKSHSGIPRPILSTILSYTKMHLYKEMVRSKVPDEEFLYSLFLEYFPETLRKKFDLSDFEHQLQREIIATVMVNKTVNEAGITLIPNQMALTHSKPVTISVAYIIANELFEAEKIRNDIYASLPAKSIDKAYEANTELESFLSKIVSWLLINYHGKQVNFELIDQFKTRVNEFREAKKASLEGEDEIQWKQASQKFEKMGLSKELANELAFLRHMENSLEIIILQEHTQAPLDECIKLHCYIEQEFYFSELQRILLDFQSSSPWKRKHRGILVRRLNNQKQRISRSIIESEDKELSANKQIEAYKDHHSFCMHVYEKDYKAFTKAGADDLSGFSVLVDHLESL